MPCMRRTVVIGSAENYVGLTELIWRSINPRLDYQVKLPVPSIIPANPIKCHDTARLNQMTITHLVQSRLNEGAAMAIRTIGNIKNVK